ncbi:MAG: hypothetical protein JW987_10630 [Anaerolineaceae bacterium]|nr:hypothetical protein [Anaerolineaceae bacterium]
MANTSAILGILVIVGIVGLIILGVIMVIWAQRRKLSSRDEMAAQMAFQRLTDTAELLERVRSLYMSGRSNALRIEFAYWRKLGETTFYWFSLMDDSGEDSTALGETMLLAASPELSVPRLSVFAMPEIPGKVGGMVENLLDMVINKALSRGGLTRVDFPEDEKFAERFVVGSLNDTAARTFFDDRRRALLLGIPVPAVHIQAGRDMVWVQPLNITSGGQKVELSDRIRQNIELTQRVMVIFS